jgi:hypothetical protein
VGAPALAGGSPASATDAVANTIVAASIAVVMILFIFVS